jgi:hypothetical protein
VVPTDILTDARGLSHQEKGTRLGEDSFNRGSHPRFVSISYPLSGEALKFEGQEVLGRS